MTRDLDVLIALLGAPPLFVEPIPSWLPPEGGTEPEEET